MSLREAFGIRGLLIRLTAIVYGPILLVFGFIAWLLHTTVNMTFFLSVIVPISGLLAYLTYVAASIRFDNAVTEKHMDIQGSMENVSNAVLATIAINRWKLVDSNRKQGTFKARIDMTFQTWGQVVTITVSRISDISSTVNVRCEAIAQKFDWGKNEQVVSRFQQQLMTILT